MAALSAHKATRESKRITSRNPMRHTSLDVRVLLRACYRHQQLDAVMQLHGRRLACYKKCKCVIAIQNVEP